MNNPSPSRARSARRWPRQALSAATGFLTLAALTVPLVGTPQVARAGVPLPAACSTAFYGSANTTFISWDSAGANPITWNTNRGLGDVAVTNDNHVYGIDLGSTPLYEFGTRGSPQENSIIRTIPITGTRYNWNSLSALPDGTLLTGATGVQTVYQIDPQTGVTSVYKATPGYSPAGDFLPMPNGDVLMLANGPFGSSQYGLLRLKPDGRVVPVGALNTGTFGTPFGAARNNGNYYVAFSGGAVARLNYIPLFQNTSALPLTETFRYAGALWGLAALGEADPGCAPGAQPDEATTPQNTPVELRSEANDRGNDWDVTTVQFVTAPGTTGPTLTVANEGTWTVNSTTGDTTFTPLPSFVGTTTPIVYTINKVGGGELYSAQQTVTVTATVAPDLSGIQTAPTLAQGQTATVPLSDAKLGSSTATIAKTELIDPATGQPTDSVTLPGEGVWAIVDGNAVFTPDPAFTGTTTTPVTARVTDSNGLSAEAPLTATVTPVVSNPPSGSGDQGQPATVKTGLGPTMDASTVAFPEAGQPAGATVSNGGKTLTVPNEGTWTVTPEGDLVFTPVAGFTGDPTPVQFTAADASGATSPPATATVAYPNVEDEVSGQAALGQPIVVDTKLSAAMDPASVVYPSADQPAGSTVSPDGKTLRVPNEGTWTVNPDGGLVFTPEANFTGQPTPVKFTADNAAGDTALPGTATGSYPDVPDAATGSAALGQPATIDTKLGANMDPASVVYPTEGQPEGSTVSDDGKTLTVPGEGVWSVNPEGDLVFTPESTFTGNPTPVKFTADDKAGNAALPGTATATYPVVSDASGFTGDQGQPATVDTNLGANMDPASVVFPTEGQPAGAEVSSDGKTLRVPNEGTWTVAPDGDLVFTPADGFTGNPTPVAFTAKDDSGNTSPPATATVVYPDVADTVPGAAPQGSPATVDTALAANMDPNSVVFPTADQPSGSTVSDDGKTLTVPGEGEWTVNPDGDLVFTPESTFSGDPTPVKFTAKDTAGNSALPATASVDYPDVPDAATGSAALGQPATIDTNLGANMDPASVVYPTEGQPEGSTVSDDGKTLTVPGEGVWTVNPDGDLVFTPESAFTGTPKPVTFTASDTAGNAALPGTATASYPDVTDEVSAAGVPGEPTLIDTNLGANMDPASVVYPTEGQPAGATVSNDGKTLTVPNEGTWTVTPDGDLLFTPDPAFTGTPTPVKFTANDTAGNTSAPGTATAVYPDVADTVPGAAPQGTPATVDTALTANMDPNSVVFPTEGQPAGSTVSPDGKTLRVPNEGTWTVNPDGDLVFTPESTFTGDPTPVKFTAKDTAGNSALPATASVDYPDVPDTATGSAALGQPATIDTNLGANMDPASVVYPTEGQPEGSTVSDDGKTLTVPGEGVWSVNPEGDLVFTPESTFTGTPKPVTFTASDTAGNAALPGTATASYPDVTDEVSAAGVPGEPTLIDTNLGANMDPASVVYPTEGQPAGATVSNDGKTLTVPNEGTWTVTPDGDLLFTPDPAFTGTPTPVKFTANDTAGNTSAPGTATAVYPDVADTVPGAAPQGTPATVDTALTANMDPNSVVFPTEGQPAGSTVSPDGKTLRVPNEGTWTVNPDGDLVFTPEPTFSGDPTPVKFTAKDTAGNSALPATASVDYPDVPDAATGSAALGQPATIDTNLGANMDPASVVYPTEGQPEGSTVSDDGKTLTVPGEGVWSVNPEGDLVFTPESTFTGNPTPVKFTADDKAGNAALPGTATATYPVVSDASGFTGDQGQPATVDTNLGANMDPASVVFPTEGQPAGAEVSSDGKTLRVPNEGTWTVTPDGDLVFTPDAGFTGNPTPVVFTAKDAGGNTSRPATATVVYPNVEDAVSGQAALGQPATIDTNLGANMDPASVKFPAAGQPAGSTVSPDGKTLTLPGEGVWTVTPEGDLVFTPEPTFTGNPTPVKFTADDKAGNAAIPGTASALYPVVGDTPAGSGNQGQPVTLTPVLGTNMDPTSVQFPTDGQPNGATTGSDGKTLTVPGEGTWTVNPDGTVTFTPEPNFTGDPTPVKITAKDNLGNESAPGTLSVVYPDVADSMVGSGTPGGPATVDTNLGANMDPASVKFPTEGQPAGATVSPDGKTLTVPNEGVWTVTPDGDLVFTPDAAFTGNPSPVQVTAADKAGNVSLPGTAQVVYPEVKSAVGKGNQGSVVTVETGLGETMNPASVAFSTAGQPQGAVPSADGKTLTIPGEGTWTVKADGNLVFTPLATFDGDASPVLYGATDRFGNVSKPSTASVDYPNVYDVVGETTPLGQTGWVDPKTDPNMDFTTTTFPAAGQPTGAIVAADGRSMVVPGQGVWTIDTTTGRMSFTPEMTASGGSGGLTLVAVQAFRGTPTPVMYTMRDTAGFTALSATARVPYPDVLDATGTSNGDGLPVTVKTNLADNMDKGSVRFPTAGQPAGAVVSADGKTLTIPNQGVWTVQPNGDLLFTPQPGFRGVPSPVRWQASDIKGNPADPAWASVKLANPATAGTPGAQAPGNGRILPTWLARTGSNLAPIGGAALLLAGLGFALRVISRRKK